MRTGDGWDWDDLSDGELRARLEQRGCTTGEAARLVELRDFRDTAAVIDRVLEGR